MVSTWKSGNKLYATIRNNHYAGVTLGYTNLVWNKKDASNQYVDSQSFGVDSQGNPIVYYTGDDYDSPTAVILSPGIDFPGGGTQWDWIITFGNVVALTKTYSGSLTFGSCVVNVIWSARSSGQAEEEKAAGKEVPVDAAKGAPRLVQPSEGRHPGAPSWRAQIYSLLEQAGNDLSTWLFDRGQQRPRTAARDPNQVLANPPR